MSTSPTVNKGALLLCRMTNREACGAGGKGAYAAVDAVGGQMTKQLSLALRDGGTVYVYGALSNEPIQVDNLEIVYKFTRVEVSSCPCAYHWRFAVCIHTAI